MIIRVIYSDRSTWQGEPCDWSESPVTYPDDFGIAAIKIFFKSPYSCICDGHSFYGFQETEEIYRMVTWDLYTDRGQELQIDKEDFTKQKRLTFLRKYHPKDIEYRQGAWMQFEEYLELLETARSWQR